MKKRQNIKAPVERLGIAQLIQSTETPKALIINTYVLGLMYSQVTLVEKGARSEISELPIDEQARNKLIKNIEDSELAPGKVNISPLKGRKRKAALPVFTPTQLRSNSKMSRKLLKSSK